MTLSDFFTKEEFNRISTSLPGWEFEKEYSEEESYDKFDEQLEDRAIFVGYDSDQGKLLEEMVGKNED